MILPLRLVWNLRVPFYERIGIIATFGVALLCVAAAIVRVVSVGSKAGTSTPSSSWLALWAVIEGAIGKRLRLGKNSRTGLANSVEAVIVGCLPSFAIAIKRSYSTRHAYSYSRHGTTSSKQRQRNFPLATIGSTPRLTPQGSTWTANAATSSEENILNDKTDTIAVTRTLQIDDSHQGARDGRP